MAAQFTIEQYARKALKGDPNASAPDDTALAIDVLTVESEMQAKFPCTASIPASGTDADKEAYNRWIGYLVAAEYIGTPAGQVAVGAAGGTIETRLGPVTEKTTQPTPEQLTRDYTKTANAARALISCIRARFAKSETANLMNPDLLGRRRTIGDAGTVEGDLLGAGGYPCPPGVERRPRG